MTRCHARPAVDTPRTVRSVVARMSALGAALPPGTGWRSSTGSICRSPRRSDRRIDTRRLPGPARRRARWTYGSPSAIWRPSSGGRRRRPPACWRPLFQCAAIPASGRCSSRSRASTRTSGTTWRSPSWTPAVPSAANPPTWRTSSTGSGDILVSLEERIREDLMPGPDLLQIADPLTHLLGSWSLDAAPGTPPGRRPGPCGGCADCRSWPRSSPSGWTRRWAWRGACLLTPLSDRRTGSELALSPPAARPARSRRRRRPGPGWWGRSCRRSGA